MAGTSELLLLPTKLLRHALPVWAKCQAHISLELPYVTCHGLHQQACEQARESLRKDTSAMLLKHA